MFGSGKSPEIGMNPPQSEHDPAIFIADSFTVQSRTALVKEHGRW
jgi:hypothetical protein